MSVETINSLLAPLTLISHIILAAVIIYFLIRRNHAEDWIVKFIGKNGLLFAFLVALGATSFSLYYSEIAGFEPCVLCWYQRIFMYPLIIILGIALHKKDRSIVSYALPLSAIGALIAIYHNYIYYGGQSILPCNAFGQGVSCAIRYVFEFGYITIPIMSLTGFLLMIFFLSAQKFYNKSSQG